MNITTVIECRIPHNVRLSRMTVIDIKKRKALKMSEMGVKRMIRSCTVKCKDPCEHGTSGERKKKQNRDGGNVTMSVQSINHRAGTYLPVLVDASTLRAFDWIYAGHPRDDGLALVQHSPQGKGHRNFASTLRHLNSPAGNASSLPPSTSTGASNRTLTAQ